MLTFNPYCSLRGFHIVYFPKESSNNIDYAPRLAEATKEGRLLGLTGIPLFIVNNQYQITGAQPLDVFRNFLGRFK